MQVAASLPTKNIAFVDFAINANGMIQANIKNKNEINGRQKEHNENVETHQA